MAKLHVTEGLRRWSVAEHPTDPGFAEWLCSQGVWDSMVAQDPATIADGSAPTMWRTDATCPGVSDVRVLCLPTGEVYVASTQNVAGPFPTRQVGRVDEGRWEEVLDKYELFSYDEF